MFNFYLFFFKAKSLKYFKVAVSQILQLFLDLHHCKLKNEGFGLPTWDQRDSDKHFQCVSKLNILISYIRDQLTG